jgi:hypothetical protein
MRFLLFALLFILSQANPLTAQEEDIANSLYMGVSYNTQWPVGELADRYGRNNAFGVSFDLLLKGKWLVSLDGQFLFGRDIKENTLGNILTSDGALIDKEYELALLDFSERGIHISGRFGKIHDLFHRSHISGIRWTIGLGYLQHKIKLQDDNNAILLFEDDYVKGYDRLSGGLAISEFIGYQFLDERGTLNLFAGLEFTQGLTKNLRKYNYNTMLEDNDIHFDMLVGLRAGIQITIRSFKDPDEITY